MLLARVGPRYYVPNRKGTAMGDVFYIQVQTQPAREAALGLERVIAMLSCRDYKDDELIQGALDAAIGAIRDMGKAGLPMVEHSEYSVDQ